MRTFPRLLAACAVLALVAACDEIPTDTRPAASPAVTAPARSTSAEADTVPTSTTTTPPVTPDSGTCKEGETLDPQTGTCRGILGGGGG